jgi:hypothetical protein
MRNRIIAGVMVFSGLLTLTMLYAAVAPGPAAQQMFQEDVNGAMASIVVPNWGVLIGLMGALLLFGAFNPGSRRLALAVAGVSKAVFVGLVLAQGQQYLPGLGVAVAIDSVMVVLFVIFVVMLSGAKTA